MHIQKSFSRNNIEIIVYFEIFIKHNLRKSHATRLKPIIQKVNMSWSSIFNDATFQEILLPSSGNVNDYITHILRTYEDLDWHDET